MSSVVGICVNEQPTAPTGATAGSPPPAPARRTRDPLALLALGLLWLYRLPWPWRSGPTCRFEPSCSAYAMEAFEIHGGLRGGWMTLRRLLRCHPLRPGGYDPVPPQRRHNSDNRTNDGRAAHAGSGS